MSDQRVDPSYPIQDAWKACNVDAHGNPHQPFSPHGCPATVVVGPVPQPPVHQVPEPSTLALVLLAFAVLVMPRRRA